MCPLQISRYFLRARSIKWIPNGDGHHVRPAAPRTLLAFNYAFYIVDASRGEIHQHGCLGRLSGRRLRAAENQLRRYVAQRRLCISNRWLQRERGDRHCWPLHCRRRREYHKRGSRREQQWQHNPLADWNCDGLLHGGSQSAWGNNRTIRCELTN